MRTTVTLDDDLALELRKLQARRKASFKQVLNEVLRKGLARETARGAVRARFETAAVDLGPCLVGTLDDVGEALALSEGDSFR